jgi:four helix bundle protein
MAVKNFKDLIAWQKAMDLVEMVYRLTKQFTPEELYGLTSQLRRAVVSIPSNIAEGQGRNTENEFNRFLSIAYGSLREVETQLLIAIRLEYVRQSDFQPVQDLCDETGRILNGLMNSLRKERAD